MAITQTYLLYATTPGTDIANRPAGAYLRFMCDSASDLPSAGVIDGDRAFTNDTGRTYARSGGAWALVVAAVTSANAIITTSDTAALPIGAVTDGQFLKRVGSSVVGASGGSGGGAAWGDITGTLSAQSDLQTALNAKQAAGSYATAAQGATADSALQPAGNGSALTGLTKTQVGLGNVDNTSDAGKPVSTAQQTVLDLKANLASPSFTTPALGVSSGTSLAATGAITSNGTAGIGYATGAGGTVTQATSKSTGVTLNKLCGTITMNGAALAAATIVSFTVTNSTVAATDVIHAQHDTIGTIGGYTVMPNTSAAGSFRLTIRNNTAGSLSEAIVIRFAVIKAVAA